MPTAYPITNARNSFPSYDVDRPLDLKGLDLLYHNAGLRNGGMRYTAATSTTVGAPITIDTDFSAVWVGLPTTGNFLCFKSESGNFTGLNAAAGIATVYINGIAQPITFNIPSYEATWSILFNASTGTFTFDLSGANPQSSAGGDESCINAMPVGWGAAFSGTVILDRYANFIMTSDEILGASRNEAVGRLAFKASVPTPTTVFEHAAGTVTVSGASTTGFTSSASSGQYFIVQRYNQAGLHGQTATVTFTASGPGDVYFATGTMGLASFVAGTNTVTVPCQTNIDPRLYFRVTGDIVISNFAITGISGTVANYAPENCTSLNRRLDSVGGYHLAPVSGATALNPQPAITREEEFRYDLGASSLTDGPPDWTFVKSSTGVLTITPPSYASSIKPPVAVANSGSNDHIVASSTNQSTGVITINSRTGGAAADSVIVGSVKHKE